MNQKTTYIIILIVIVVVGGWFYFSKNGGVINNPPVQNATTTVYANSQYGFTVTLPKSWEGYSIVSSTWQGSSLDANGQNYNSESGPFISVRNPLWSSTTPYQDIPIYVFTLKQWSDIQADKFHVGAAPIGPSELARNANYVFALPARYNYAYPAGFQEVDQLIQGGAVKSF